jgi:hypothetical protein
MRTFRCLQLALQVSLGRLNLRNGELEAQQRRLRANGHGLDADHVEGIQALKGGAGIDR